MAKRRRRPSAPPPPHDPDWAKKAVDKMSEAEVRDALRRLGHAPIERPRDTRSPIERMIDEATGYKSGGAE
jgi:hypothetical protein